MPRKKLEMHPDLQLSIAITVFVTFQREQVDLTEEQAWDKVQQIVAATRALRQAQQLQREVKYNQG